MVQITFEWIFFNRLPKIHVRLVTGCHEKKKLQADGSSCKHYFSVILLRMRCQWYGERICLRTAAPLSTHLAPPIILRSTLKKCKYFSSHVWVSLSTMKETNFSLRRFFVYSFFFLFGCIVATTASLEGWEIGTHPPTSWKIRYCEIEARRDASAYCFMYVDVFVACLVLEKCTI